MNAAQPTTDYILGSSDREHVRLMRQARTIAPYTERLFRDAGITTGQRVLDVGSGVGDVALLTASLVGTSGSVVGIDRDARALAKARSRIAAACATNIQFLDSDLLRLHVEGDFDAIVGRFILMFLPDPVSTLGALTALLRPGGVIVFQEGSWASHNALAGHLPLRVACAELICSTFRRAGARPDSPLRLYQDLLECGYEAPHLRVEVPVASDAGGYDWLPELIASLSPHFDTVSAEARALGDIDTLSARLESERQGARSFVPIVGLAGAWARKAI
jgi:ubiquinone/menaquinone biosynthesis C-methylase UbiE